MPMHNVVAMTPRIAACLWEEDDARLLADLHSAPETSGYITGERPWDMEKAKTKLAKYRSEHGEDGTGKYKLLSREAGTFIGRAGVSSYERAAGEYELGYVLKPAFWGRGLATEIAVAMASRFFSLGLSERLIAFSDEWNRPSHRVLEKAGFKFSRKRVVGGVETLEFVAFGPAHTTLPEVHLGPPGSATPTTGKNAPSSHCSPASTSL